MWQELELSQYFTTRSRFRKKLNMGTNFNTAAYVLEASHVPKFPGDYKPTGPKTFIFHLFLFAEHDQLTILTQEGSLQTSLLIL